jgi:hypothetical protein
MVATKMVKREPLIRDRTVRQFPGHAMRDAGALGLSSQTDEAIPIVSGSARPRPTGSRAARAVYLLPESVRQRPNRACEVPSATHAAIVLRIGRDEL